MMNVLVIGDIVGQPGRRIAAALIPALKDEFKLDLVVANAENAAGGSGLTPAIVGELLDAGVGVITSGDHIWKKKEVLDIIAKEERLLRPANYAPDTPGKGSVVVQADNGEKIGVLNLQGRVFMAPIECPFRTAAEAVKEIKTQTPLIIVDIHAEATSEKIALARYLDGRVSAVFGTHTHVQTADEHILKQGTAYITDLGMTGPHDSVIGRRQEQIIQRFVTGMPAKFEMASADVRLSGAVIEIDETTGKASSIKRIQRSF